MSGAGKSTVGSLLAARLGARFIDADDLHPAANLEKLRAGIPLDEADREPWLDRLGASIASEAAVPTVAACSALRLAHRERLRRHVPDLLIIQLVVPPAELTARVAARVGHFMAPSLLTSQLADLEPLEAHERGFVLPVSVDPPGLVEQIVARLD